MTVMVHLIHCDSLMGFASHGWVVFFYSVGLAFSLDAVACPGFVVDEVSWSQSGEESKSQTGRVLPSSFKYAETMITHMAIYTIYNWASFRLRASIEKSKRYDLCHHNV